jgi:hypothetical protein
MGSRQRPSPHNWKNAGGQQARAGEGAQTREAAAEQRRDEEEMLSAAREDAEDTLPSDEPAANRSE